MPLSQTEYIARQLLKHYLPRVHFVYNLRPEWLKHPKSGRRVELDIYAPDLTAAWEIQGVQHGRYIEGMQRDFDAFVGQQGRDMFKIEACKERGITLHRLTSFDLLPFSFERHIRPYVSEADWRRHNPPVELFQEAERLTRQRAVKRRPPSRF